MLVRVCLANTGDKFTFSDFACRDLLRKKTHDQPIQLIGILPDGVSLSFRLGTETPQCEFQRPGLQEQGFTFVCQEATSLASRKERHIKGCYQVLDPSKDCGELLTECFGLVGSRSISNNGQKDEGVARFNHCAIFFHIKYLASRNASMTNNCGKLQCVEFLDRSM